MSLLLTFAVLAVSIAAVLYALAVVLQGYLYGEPANRLPLRALAGGALVAAFLTFWIQINVRAETAEKYGTLFEFNSTATKGFDEFTAVRRHSGKDAEGNPRESRVKFGKLNGTFIEGKDTSRVFKLTTSDYLVTAIEVPNGDAVTRFEAELFVPDDAKPGELRLWRAGDAASPTYSREQIRVFREANGRRYVEFSALGTPGAILAPNRGAWIGAVLLNVGHLLVWFVAFWPVMRYTSGTALGLAALFCAVTMLFALPFLFERHRSPPPPPAGVADARG